MKKFFALLFNIFVLFSLSAQTDNVPTLLPPTPPTNPELAHRIPLPRNQELTLTNLVVFIRFADDEEFTESLEPIDLMFNDSTPYNISVYNYFNVMTYGKINYHTVYTNNIINSVIISYQDLYPRSYYLSNPPVFVLEAVETCLLGRALRYVDSLNLVDPDVNLDGNNDGLIDNISFILKGDVDFWGQQLWPHMGYFNAYYSGLPDSFNINGKVPYCYNFEFANSGSLFSTNVFCHEMGHSLGIPDYYHYYNYPFVHPVYFWDLMGQNNLQQVSTILKYKFLGIIDEPIEITEDGHYILNSNTSSDHNNCYFIRSSIDPNQWYTIEYRNCDDFMENVPHSGVIIGRWNDNVDLEDIMDAGNGYFDFYTRAHSYWVFRPGSSIDTIDGEVNQAAFGYDDRTSFGPTTDPHPYLTNGTPETSFEITNIQFSGDQASFDVHFLHDGVPTYDKKNSHIYPNPASNELNLSLEDVNRVEIYDLLGKMILSEEHPESKMNVSSLMQGAYFVKIYTENNCYTEKFIKK